MPTHWLSMWARASTRSPTCSWTTSSSIPEHFAWLFLCFSIVIFVLYFMLSKFRIEVLHIMLLGGRIGSLFHLFLLYSSWKRGPGCWSGSWLLAGYLTPEEALHVMSKCSNLTNKEKLEQRTIRLPWMKKVTLKRINLQLEVLVLQNKWPLVLWHLFRSVYFWCF